MPKKTVDTELSLPSRPASDESILKVTKEVVVKFIEVGRLTPTNFDETFRSVYQTIYEAVRAKPEKP